MSPAIRCCSSEIDRQLADAAPGATARLLDVPPIAGAALLGLDYVGAPTAPKLLRACSGLLPAEPALAEAVYAEPGPIAETAKSPPILPSDGLN